MASATAKKYWNPCQKCHGKGTTRLGPSKRRRRKYKRQFQQYENNPGELLQPRVPQPISSMCLNCNGSGLVRANIPTTVNLHFPNIAIIGGGIGGTALAVACLHRGIPFTLYERDGSFDERSQGYGLTLQQASKAISGLGIDIHQQGITSTRHVVHNPSGKVIGEWGIRKWLGNDIPNNSKRKNIHIPRQDLRLSLLEQLHGSQSIRWGYRFKDFSKNDSGNWNIYFEYNSETITETADVIVGADGIYSSLRPLLIDEKKYPQQYLDCIVILGICPLDSLPWRGDSLLDSASVFQTVNGNDRVYMMPYDKNTIMWQFSFPIDEQDAISLSKKGSKAMKNEILNRVQNWHTPIPEIISATLASDITGYPVYDSDVLDADVLHDSDNATLLGDAAHPMSPFKGQGANQAILDALNLARDIYKKCDSHSSWKEKGLRNILLSSYEQNMIQRTESKVRDSRIAAQALHSDAVLHDNDTPRGRGLV